MLMSAVVMAFFGGCSYKKGDRITNLYFIGCTDYNTVLVMDEESIGSKWRSGLRGEAAKELIREVEALPETAGEEGDPIYIFRLTYVEDGVTKNIERKGYHSFPENWSKLIDLLNQVANGYKTLIKTTDIAIVDAEYLKQYFNIDESVLPDDTSLNEIISEMNITYMTLFEKGYPDSGIQYKIVDHLYEKYGLFDLQPEKLDENPKTSSEEEMRAFAKERLDEMYDGTASYACAGKYKGANYTIIRYDELQAYMDWESGFWTKCGFERVGKNLRYRAELRDADGGAMVTQSEDLLAFVDASGRFIILTDSKRPSDIAEVIQ